MILHDFKCEECGEVEEHMCSSGDEMSICDACGGHSHKIFLTTAKPHWLALAQGDNASPEAIDKFEKMHKQQKAKEEKSYDEHGDYGAAPGSSGGRDYGTPKQ